MNDYIETTSTEIIFMKSFWSQLGKSVGKVRQNVPIFKAPIEQNNNPRTNNIQKICEAWKHYVKKHVKEKGQASKC